MESNDNESNEPANNATANDTAPRPTVVTSGPIRVTALEYSDGDAFVSASISKIEIGWVERWAGRDRVTLLDASGEPVASLLRDENGEIFVCVPPGRCPPRVLGGVVNDRPPMNLPPPGVN